MLGNLDRGGHSRRDGINDIASDPPAKVHTATQGFFHRHVALDVSHTQVPPMGVLAGFFPEIAVCGGRGLTR